MRSIIALLVILSLLLVGCQSLTGAPVAGEDAVDDKVSDIDAQIARIEEELRNQAQSEEEVTEEEVEETTKEVEEVTEEPAEEEEETTKEVEEVAEEETEMEASEESTDEGVSKTLSVSEGELVELNVAVQDDEDVTADFLYFKSGSEMGRYLLEFTSSLESDVDDSAGSQTSTGLYLTDIEDTAITMFGKDYTIVQARRTSSVGNNVKLTLMGGAVRDTLLEGNTKTYTIGGTDYETTVDFVDANSAKFTVNGEGTRDLLDGETDKLSDGTTLGVSEILYQDYAGGVHQATFFLGAQKLEIKDTNINNINKYDYKNSTMGK